MTAILPPILKSAKDCEKLGQKIMNIIMLSICQKRILFSCVFRSFIVGFAHVVPDLAILPSLLIVILSSVKILSFSLHAMIFSFVFGLFILKYWFFSCCTLFSPYWV